MKLKLLSVFAVLLCLSLLSSCTGKDNAGDTSDTEQTEANESAKADTTVAAESTAPEAEFILPEAGEQAIEYSPDRLVKGDTWEEKEISGYTVRMIAPDDLKPAEENGNSREFLRYDKETVWYVRSFEFSSLFEVAEDSVMDENCCKIMYKNSRMIDFEKFTAKVGKNSSGLDYVLYISESDGSFRGITFVRTDTDKIMQFDFSAPMEYRESLDRMIDTFSVVK